MHLLDMIKKIKMQHFENEDSDLDILVLDNRCSTNDKLEYDIG